MANSFIKSGIATQVVATVNTKAKRTYELFACEANGTAMSGKPAQTKDF